MYAVNNSAQNPAMINICVGETRLLVNIVPWCVTQPTKFFSIWRFTKMTVTYWFTNALVVVQYSIWKPYVHGMTCNTIVLSTLAKFVAKDLEPNSHEPTTLVLFTPKNGVSISIDCSIPIIISVAIFDVWILFAAHLCATCGKGFKNKCTLKKHEVIHSDVRPFVCPDCPKRFQLLGPLKTHMAVHRAAKHVCLICGVIKKSAATLRNHEGIDFDIIHNILMHMIHFEFLLISFPVKHQERKKECEICGYKFFTNDGLNKHMRTHTGEKPFKVCNIRLFYT